MVRTTQRQTRTPVLDPLHLSIIELNSHGRSEAVRLENSYESTRQDSVGYALLHQQWTWRTIRDIQKATVGVNASFRTASGIYRVPDKGIRLRD